MLKRQYVSTRPTPIVYDLLPILKLEKITQANGIRHYITPEGVPYPSITTVLATMNGNWLDSWKAAVGIEEANKVSRRATDRGTKIHHLFESYIRDGFLDYTQEMPDVRAMVKNTIPHLNNINRVLVQETPLYSDTLRLAGTPDLVAEWNGVLSVIDYKNSSHPKEEKDIEGYFSQCTGYAIMLYERFGLMAKQIVVIISVEGYPTQVFVKRTKDYKNYLLTAIKKYWTTNGEKETLKPMEVGKTFQHRC